MHRIDGGPSTFQGYFAYFLQALEGFFKCNVMDLIGCQPEYLFIDYQHSMKIKT